MGKIYVSTLDPGAYYTMSSILKTAGIKFYSAIPGEIQDSGALVLTTRKDLTLFQPRNVLLLEEMDEDPLLFSCQVFSRLERVEESITLGIDPGKRIGVAVQVGDLYVGTANVNSVRSLELFIEKLMRRFQNYRIRVKVGDGDIQLAVKLLKLFKSERFHVEIVDESGTSGRKVSSNMTRDQSAATRILLKRGKIINN